MLINNEILFNRNKSMSKKFEFKVELILKTRYQLVLKFPKEHLKYIFLIQNLRKDFLIQMIKQTYKLFQLLKHFCNIFFHEIYQKWFLTN